MTQGWTEEWQGRFSTLFSELGLEGSEGTRILTSTLLTRTRTVVSSSVYGGTTSTTSSSGTRPVCISFLTVSSPSGVSPLDVSISSGRSRVVDSPTRRHRSATTVSCVVTGISSGHRVGLCGPLGVRGRFTVDSCCSDRSHSVVSSLPVTVNPVFYNRLCSPSNRSTHTPLDGRLSVDGLPTSTGSCVFGVSPLRMFTGVLLVSGTVGHPLWVNGVLSTSTSRPYPLVVFSIRTVVGGVILVGRRTRDIVFTWSKVPSCSHSPSLCTQRHQPPGLGGDFTTGLRGGSTCPCTTPSHTSSPPHEVPTVVSGSTV